MASPRSSTSRPPTAQQAAKQATGQRKVSDRRATRKATQPEDALEDPADQIGEELRTDLGPWAETPASSRVSGYRYDHMKREVQVTWRNQTNPGYAYEGMDYEAFRSFARAASKGKYINRVLNGYPYRRLDPDDVSAPSNERRKGLTSRTRG